MRKIKVVLFINLLLWALYGLTDLFFPELLVQMGMGQDPVSARHVAAVFLGLTVVIWHAFRDPARYIMVIDALVFLNAIDLLVGVFQSTRGIEPWANSSVGIALNLCLGAGLVAFRPRRARVEPGLAVGRA
ncbi:MAG: hypothetical protein HYZ29_04010 [Myxococcales bacterium]|nr:hypothetical protein [Myxococcales bacterium]